jgi:hypothetical protein
MDSRDALATVDKPLTIVLEPLGEGKIRVRTSSWVQEVVDLAWLGWITVVASI